MSGPVPSIHGRLVWKSAALVQLLPDPNLLDDMVGRCLFDLMTTHGLCELVSVHHSVTSVSTQVWIYVTVIARVVAELSPRSPRAVTLGERPHKDSNDPANKPAENHE